MGEGLRKFEAHDDFARKGIELEDADYADPVRKAEIDRILAVRDAVLKRHADEDLYDAYMELAQSLPKDTRLYHYFIGSTPAADAVNFDTEDGSVLSTIEAFGRQHGLLSEPLH